MVIRFGGGSSGIVEYLETGQKSGREHSRDELDKRVILSGDIRLLDEVLAQFTKDDESEHYMHITLSFKERKIDEETLRAIDQEFRQFVFAATGRDDEFYYYSEAHLPKIKRLKDMNGDDYERFPHIHIVIPKYNLYTGTRDDMIGLHNPIIPYTDAFQEYINAKYNLASPKDNRRFFILGKDGSINRKRLTDENAQYNRHSLLNQNRISYFSRQTVKNEIFNLIRADKTISSVEDLAEALKPLGEVKIRDSKKFGQKYINFRLNGYPDKKAINLKDNVFLDNYLKTRSLKETQAYAIGHGNQELLQEWYSKKAFEHRFIYSGNQKQRDAYYHTDETTQQQILQQKITIHQRLLQEMQYAEPLEKSRPKNYGQPHLRQSPTLLQNAVHINQVPHINDMPHINQMPHINELPVTGGVNAMAETNIKDSNNERQQRNHREQSNAIDIRTSSQRTNHQKGRQSLPNLPTSSGNAQRNRAGKQDDRTDLLYPPAFDDLDNTTQKSSASVFLLRNQRRLKQKTYSTPTQSLAVLQRASDDYHIKQADILHKINAVDCRLLLDMCSVKYGLSTSDFNISINPYGNDRIQVENKTLNAAEFLQQYMNLSHTESEQIIDNTLQQQKIGFRQRSPVSSLMWARFNREEAAALKDFQILRQKYRADKQKVFDRNRFKVNPNESKAQSVVRRKFINQKRDYELSQLQEQYRPLFKEHKKPNERYLEWLHKESVSGSLNALLELQRVYPHYKERIDEDNHWLAFQSKSDEIPYPRQHAPDFGLSVFIHKNGTLDYRDEHGNTLISNAYNAVIVKEKTAENIARALQIAQAKFGKNGFEIVNASLRDMATIQAAVDKTQIAVSVKEKDNKVKIERGR
ncbi:MAG: hypothetical protein IJV35_01935 [Neisseriaceae bacterium]|nr:hypothetical protein [Neisseriaceae bacterium]